MASPLALAIECDEACSTIESALDVAPGTIRRLHRDQYVLRKIQLGEIASLIVTSPRADKNIEILQRARDLVKLSNWTKADLIVILAGD